MQSLNQVPCALSDQERAALRYVLIMPVWGDQHTGLFLRYCIPFLLTDGNVGAFPDRQLQVHVTSRRADFARMRADRNYQRLQQLTQLVETEIDGVIDISLPHRAMTECYLHVLRHLPSPATTVTFFPTPDCILSRGALLGMKRRIEAGWRAIMLCGVRLELETAGPVLDQIVGSAGGPSATAERDLVQRALPHLHPISLSCDATSDKAKVNWPSHVYWVAPDRKWLVAHCFHLHPMAVRGVPEVIDINTTIDGNYLVGLGIGAEKYYVCESSDELFCMELSPEAKRLPGRDGHLTERSVARFSAIGCNALHRGFFQRPILFRGVSEPEIPADVAAQVAQFTAAVKRGPNLFDRYVGLVLSTIRANPVLLSLAKAAKRTGRRISGTAVMPNHNG